MEKMKKMKLARQIIDSSQFFDEDAVGMINEYCDYVNNPDGYIYRMDELNEHFTEPWEAVRSAFYGGRHNFAGDSFNPNDSWFTYNGYGNLVSIPYPLDYIEEMLEEMVESGIFDNIIEEEEEGEE